MNCEECQPLLEELFDAESDREATHRARAHMASCRDCADAFEELRREQELYLRYEFDTAPAPEAFWSQVMARATETPANDGREQASHPSSHGLSARLRAFLGAFAAPRFSPTLTAALVLFAVLLTIIVTRYADTHWQTNEDAAAVAEQHRPEGRPERKSEPAPERAPQEQARADSSVRRETTADEALTTTTADEVRRDAQTSARREGASKKARVVRASGGESAAARDADLETPDQLVREAEQKYLAAIRLLSHDVRRNRARLDAQTAARFERTLATIDRTIAGTRRAVRQHPGDPVAVNYMLAAYARKVEVLREMASY